MPKIIRIHVWPSLHNSPSMYFLFLSAPPFLWSNLIFVNIRFCKLLYVVFCRVSMFHWACILSSLVCAKCCMFAVFSLFLCNNEIRVVMFFPSNVCLHFWITSLGKLPNGLPLTGSRHLTIFKALSTYDQRLWRNVVTACHHDCDVVISLFLCSVFWLLISL